MIPTGKSDNGVAVGEGVAESVASDCCDWDLYPELEGLNLDDTLLPESTTHKWFIKLKIQHK